MTFEKDLKKLGLSDKEAAVYLAAIGLGASPVQPIARKAKVARATTYLVLESLMKMGFISKYTEGDKTMFVAEAPGQLVRLLDERERQLEKNRDELDQLLPKLQAYVKSSDERPVVRYYAGLEGIKTVRNEMIMLSRPGDVWYQMAAADAMQAAFGDVEQATYKKQRRAKRIESRAIVAVQSPELREQLEKSTEKKWAERKFVSPKKQYTSQANMTIMSDRIVISTYTDKVGGMLIESEAVAKMVAELFEMAWNSLE